MSRVRWLALIGGALCVYVALSEFEYAHAHPYAYGPAIKIALLACGGVFLAAAAFAANLRAEAQCTQFTQFHLTLGPLRPRTNNSPDRRTR